MLNAIYYPKGGAGGGAPTGATYVVISLNGDLSAERVLAAGDGISLTDGGANGNITISLANSFMGRIYAHMGS